MSRPIVIRAARPADFPGWTPLWEGYNRFYGRSGPTALPDAITQATWARFHDPREPVRALVAERGAELVGLAHYLFHRNTIMIEPTCYMQDLFTAQDARGQGVGRRLIEGVYDAARAAGLSTVYWHTHETNAAGRALYDKVAANSGFLVYRHRL